MSCFICQAFRKNSPSNPQLAQECLTTPLSRVPSHVSTQSTLDPPRPPPLHSSRLPCYFFLTFSPPPPRFISFSPQRLPFCPSARLFRHASQARGRRVCGCQNLTKCSRPTQRVAVEMGSDLPRLDSLAVSLPPSYYFLLSIVACCSPHCCFFHSALLGISSPPPFQPLRCFLCRTFLPDLVE